MRSGDGAAGKEVRIAQRLLWLLEWTGFYSGRYVTQVILIVWMKTAVCNLIFDFLWLKIICIQKLQI